jgi:hypothetical protein
MKRRPSVSVPKGYAAAWAKLFARSPEELQSERQDRTSNAQEGAKSAPQSTQKGRIGNPPP